MTWSPVDDNLPTHDKIMRAGPDGPAVLGWHVASIIFGNVYQTDGIVRRSQLAALLPGAGPPDERMLRLLTELKLWDALTADEFRVHDFLAHNKSRAARQEAAEAERQRKREDRKRGRKRPTGRFRPSENVRPDVSARPPLRSDQSTSEQSISEEKRSTPPTPPSPGAPTATGSNPAFSLSVPNPDSLDQEAAAMPDDADADQLSRERQWQDDTRQRELGKFADWAERHGHPEVAAQIREQAKVRRPLSGPPPKPDSPDPDTVAAILARSAQRWEAFFACNRRKHPGHSDQTCPEKPPSPARAADAQARAEFGPGADDPVDEPAP
jgi:hypothetical protein